MADLRTRIVQAMRPHADLGNRCLCGQKWPTGCRFDVEQYDLHVADAVIRELTNPIRGCTDPWHWLTGKPYRCPSCGYWMGEGYV